MYNELTLLLETFFVFLLMIRSGSEGSESMRVLFLDAGAVDTGDCGAVVVVVLRREETPARPLVILRRKSEPVKTKPGDGCCGERGRRERGVGVEGIVRLTDSS